MNVVLPVNRTPRLKTASLSLAFFRGLFRDQGQRATLVNSFVRRAFRRCILVLQSDLIGLRKSCFSRCRGSRLSLGLILHRRSLLVLH